MSVQNNINLQRDDGKGIISHDGCYTRFSFLRKNGMLIPPCTIDEEETVDIDDGEQSTIDSVLGNSLMRLGSSFISSDDSEELQSVTLSYGKKRKEQTVGEETDEGSKSKRDANEVVHNDTTQLGFWDITAIQTTWSTAAVVVMMPHIYGQIGYVAAILVTGAWMMLTYLICCFICDVVLSSNGRCKHLSDVGFELAGEAGRIAFQVFQYVNLFFYLPVALETLAISFQVVFNYPFRGGLGCLGNWKLIVFGLLFVILMLTRNWKDTSRIAYFSWTILTFKALVLIPWGLVKYKDEYDINIGPAQPFGNPEPTWYGICGALIGYMSSVMFILVETMARAKMQEDYKKALGLANIFMYTYYTIPGLCAVLIWGWNVDYMINEEFPNGALSVILNLCIIFPLLLDFIIAGMPLNDAMRRRFIDKGTDNDDIDDEARGHGLIHQFKVIFPTLLWSLVFCSAVPRFESLTSIVSSLTIVPIVTFVPSLVWLFGGNRKKYKSNLLLHIVSIIFGFTVMSTELASTIYDLITTEYNNPEDFWCQSS